MTIVVVPFLYVGTLISKNFAALLEEHDIFVPEDDDDDDWANVKKKRKVKSTFAAPYLTFKLMSVKNTQSYPCVKGVSAPCVVCVVRLQWWWMVTFVFIHIHRVQTSQHKEDGGRWDTLTLFTSAHLRPLSSAIYVVFTKIIFKKYHIMWGVLKVKLRLHSCLHVCVCHSINGVDCAWRNSCCCLILTVFGGFQVHGSCHNSDSSPAITANINIS